MKTIAIPFEFQVFPFYQDEDRLSVTEDCSFKYNTETQPFYYDIVESESNIQPWQTSEQYVPQLFLLWREIQPDLQSCYQRRDRTSAHRPMRIAIAMLIQAVYWTNEQKVESIVELAKVIASLAYTPINCGERLQFILRDPTHFHSYNQVKAMFDESEKLYYRAQLLKKK
ncbi:YpoC family protein [Bacillus alkalicellulosilyticus]|uniref:YpoC family protein n=1 Tax=Alkalihalobacterium alkalicellulosilyticum TaxID=1912214 RepID=UPI0009984CA6|nr:hypothetical protein [Bacillus alkalicellulosilyticus]